MEISVSLEVYKALTSLLSHEGQSYDDVIREILGLDSVVEPEPPRMPFQNVMEALLPLRHAGGFISRGLWLPNGTQIRARYKGRVYAAKIEGDAWIDHNGNSQTSPSAAATAITDTTINGLRFWEAQRPGDVGWRRLDAFRAA